MRSTATLPIKLLLLSMAMPLATRAQHAGDAEQLALGNTWMRASASLFEENKGQVSGADAAKVRYTYTDGPLNIFLLDDGLAYQFNRTHYPEGYSRPNPHSDDGDELMRSRMDEVRVETYRMDMTLVGADPHAKVTATGRSQDATHYYKHEALDVHRYSTVTYHAVYPHIDWVIYCGADGRGVKYDFVVHPGGDPQQIAFTARWVEELKLGADGSLVLANRMGSITERTPVSFQDGREIGTRFHVEHDHISFQVDAYDANTTLIIDPSLIWSTYYGGSMDDEGRACALDGTNNIYLAGYTRNTTGIAAGGHQNVYGGGTSDAFLVKFDPFGERLWATYYGGNNTEFGLSCAVDASDNVYLAGSTRSTSGIAFGGHQNALGGDQDAFLVKFNSQGQRLWATYYGGSAQDGGTSCAIDPLGNVYMAGNTASTSGIASGGHQSSYGGGNWDAFLVKFNSDGARLWGTYYGGSAADNGTSCAIDGTSNVFLAGFTPSTSGIAFGGHQNTNAGGSNDAFLAKFDANGVLQWGTYYGGDQGEVSRSCAVDGLGNIYLSGLTGSTSGIAFQGHQNTFGGNNDAFLAKFDGAGVLLWCTYYGGDAFENAESCTVDGEGNVFMVGRTASTDRIAFNGYQETYAGGNDAYMVKFASAGELLWGTYFGGSDWDQGYGCVVNNAGQVYLAGATFSETAIATGGHQETYGGETDAFLAKFEGAPACIPTITITSDQGSTICQGQVVVYTASVTDEGTDPVYQWKRNGNNVGTNAATYVSTSDSDGDVITCELGSNTPCADPAEVLSNALTMNVVVVDDAVALVGATLTATQVDATYQWLDCNNAFAPIAGETDQSYSPAQNGNYAVEITFGICTVMSDCVEVLTTGIGEEELDALRVYPNPAAHQLTLEGAGPLGEVFVLDMQGRLVHSALTAQKRIILDAAPWAPGAYVLRVGSVALRVVKE